MTPFGCHVYKRLPMGLNSTNDVFTLQYGKAVDESTDHKRATEDTLIYARSTAELIAKTSKFFQACHKHGITLNPEKVQWDAKEILFAGFLLTDQGYEPDPKLAKVLSQFPHPKSITDMRSFFGLANQLCNFIDTIAEIMAQLKPLLKKGTPFVRLEEFEETFQKAKAHFSSKQTLSYYDAKKKTRLISDALWHRVCAQTGARRWSMEASTMWFKICHSGRSQLRHGRAQTSGHSLGLRQNTEVHRRTWKRKLSDMD
jgi:hypothetical protein